MRKDNFPEIKNYVFKESGILNEEDVSGNPFSQFRNWFDEMMKIDGELGNAMFLATSSAEGRPSVRTVLLKGFDETGFIFFTNYLSRKGTDLGKNPFASILFFWKEQERQIRIEGKVVKISRADSEKYFHSRPFESQIAASISKQSEVVESRKRLEEMFNELKEKYSDGIVPLPENWGGYKLIPDRFEFWQGRDNRMHDRISYVKENDDWKIQRLSP